MAESIFAPDWAYGRKVKASQAREYFKAFLTALKATEQSREDVLVRVKNLRPLPVDITKGFINIDYDILNDVTGDVKETRQFQIDDSCLIQISQMDDPALPVAWFKRSFKTNTQPIVAKSGNVMSKIQLDMRQQLLHNVFVKRTRLEKMFREEVPFVRSTYHVGKGRAEIGIPDTPMPRQVMGIVGKGYPLEWSTYKMIRSLGDVLVDTFSDFTLETPYMTDAGTYRVGFYSKDSKYAIEPRVGDIIGIGGVIRDNPYGRSSLTWQPRTLRLVCTNGMTSMRGEGFIRLTHNPMTTLIKDLIENILAPRRSQIGEYLNGFEADLPEPESIDFYFKNNGILYDHLARVMVARLLGSAGRLKQSYKLAAETAVKDYKAAIEYVCGRYDVGKMVKEKLWELAEQDPSINDPKEGDFTAYDLANVFTSYANSPISDDQRQRYEAIGGHIIDNSKLRTAAAICQTAE